MGVGTGMHGSFLASHVRRAAAGCLLLAVGAQGCGLLRDGETNPNADPPVVLRDRHLPELLRFTELEATPPERVLAEFRADHLYIVSTVGREQRVTELGANTGRPYASVTVTRRQHEGVPIGQLGDDFTLTFEFTSFEADGDGPLVLFGMRVSQPLHAPNVCDAARELAVREGLDGCHEQGIHPATAPDAEGYFHACVYDEDELPIEVRCAASETGDARVLTVTTTLGRMGDVEVPAPQNVSDIPTTVVVTPPPPASPEAAEPSADGTVPDATTRDANLPTDDELPEPSPAASP